VPTDPTQTAAGRALRKHHESIGSQHLRDLLQQRGRASDMTRLLGNLSVDFSRARANTNTLALLADLASELQIEQNLHAMVKGIHLNTTEDRAALHTALRLSDDDELEVDGTDVAAEVSRVKERMSRFVDSVHSGQWKGATDERITDVVNIGIGGSDLGPRMVVQALRTSWVAGIRVHFVSNVDPADLDAVLATVNPANTLFVVVSKTFTTVETLSNAVAARGWIVDALGAQATAHHMVAVSANDSGAQEFGIAPEAVFGFWDWVGGRYSLSSPVGLAIELAIGPVAMREFRRGMHEIDVAAVSTPAQDNAAIILGLLDFWYTEYFDVDSKAIIPYSQDLALFPAHMQQLQMESNGKSVTAEGYPVTWRTSPSVWGAPGTNGQHAFFQMLHQGTNLVPLDFIGVRPPDAATNDGGRGALLVSNFVAQAAVLALGRTESELSADGVAAALIPHKVMPGNRPTTVILLPDLRPQSVGQLVALYEHATVVAGFCWGINPFDQWGVELGKQMSQQLLPALEGQRVPAGTDASTTATIEAIRQGWLNG